MEIPVEKIDVIENQHSHTPDWYWCNYSNWKHIVELLRFPSRSLRCTIDIDLNDLIYDLDELLKKIDILCVEQIILDMYRRGDSLDDIADKIGIIEKQYIRNTINSIAKRVVRQYIREWNYWVNLNYVKGKYKECNKCKHVKLVQDFDIKRLGKFRSECKDCRR